MSLPIFQYFPLESTKTRLNVGASTAESTTQSATTPPSATSIPPEEITGLRRGKCKWFNVAKGWGFITPDDNGQDVFVHQSVIQMTGFRSLGDDEQVEFECRISDKGLEATKVTGPNSADCHGSHRRPVSRRRFRKIRCYNCGEFANHIAAKCALGPQPKRCHACKSEDHLIADCPKRPAGEIRSKSGLTGDSGSSFSDSSPEGMPATSSEDASAVTAAITELKLTHQ
ncbi:protein lin-28 homolog [Chrysoperla carnea]|uniref:protein lin-28 homolog n=1 Tax=Chrysoperla carnea TaxID=189513 RepID=UPI001D094B99|nr:protein lin-28 homolog [Chrysoperla carnea]